MCGEHILLRNGNMRTSVHEVLCIVYVHDVTLNNTCSTAIRFRPFAFDIRPLKRYSITGFVTDTSVFSIVDNIRRHLRPTFTEYAPAGSDHLVDCNCLKHTISDPLALL